MRTNHLCATLLALGAQFSSVSMAQSLLIEAESGVISAPFVLTNGYVYQPHQTSVTNGGRAVYDFVITNAGNYAIHATVQALDAPSNSFYVCIDGEPQDAASVWVFPASPLFAERMFTAGRNRLPNHAYNFSEGPHQLVIRGSGANARLDRLAIVRLPSPPAPPTNLRIVAGP